MKKFLVISIFSILFSLAVTAQEKNSTSPKIDESKKSTLSYVNLPIVKILEGKEAYVVLYQKNKIGVGEVVIPKAWAKGSPDSPRKFKIRKTATSMGSYLTVIKKDGQFQRVIINTTLNKKNDVWGVVDYRVPIDGVNKETLEELEL